MIYFDHAATTSIRPELLESYQQLLRDYYANPASIHRSGQESARLLKKAREQIAQYFHLPEEGVIFTSGATEANNLALKGYCHRYANRGRHIITTSIEHPSVLEACRQLESEGFTCTYLTVDHEGQINLDELRSAMRKDTILVSIMAVNNEVGTIQDLAQIADIVHQYPKAVLHSDTTQAIGKLDLPYEVLDLFVLSAHKLSGLKGSGALLRRKEIDLYPLANGGGQEYGLRSGTNDVPKEVTLAKTLRLAFEKQEENTKHVRHLNAYLREKLAVLQDEIVINTPLTMASPYILNFSFLHKKASVVVEALSRLGTMVSTTSACSSKKSAYSYVLEAMGKPKVLQSNSLRVSFGPSNTIAEIDCLIAQLTDILQSIR